MCIVHNETTTGVTSDIKKIREVIDANNHPALYLIDGVSSIGAIPFKFDEWKVDVAVTGSQKALSLPTGLALLAVSDKALEASKKAKSNRCFFDWNDWSKTFPATPYTPIIPTLWGLQKSLELIKEEGIDNVTARHFRLAEGTRRAAAGWGLSLLVKDPRWNSDSLTVIEVPQGIDSNKIVKTAYAKYNLSIGIGLSHVNGKVFRIGHLGNMDELMLSGAISGVEMCLLENGVNITPGSGIGEAIKYWTETSKVIKTRESLL